MSNERKKLKRLIKSRDRQSDLWKKTGKKGHGLLAKKLTKRIKSLRSKIKLSITPKPISSKGVDFISEFEGFFERPYNDPVGYATVGYGYLLGYRPVNSADKKGVWVKDQKERGVLTKEEGKRLLKSQLAKNYEPSVKGLFSFGGPLYGKFTQNRYDALVSFAYNLGPSSVKGAEGFETMGRAIKKGDINAIADAMLLYDKAGGLALAGLTRRRKAERRLFLDGNYSTEV
jgi:GH24 family phage-related lysozyme (muramidase)